MKNYIAYHRDGLEADDIRITTRNDDLANDQEFRDIFAAMLNLFFVLQSVLVVEVQKKLEERMGATLNLVSKSEANVSPDNQFTSSQNATWRGS